MTRSRSPTGPPAHVHHAHDETFVVLTGHMLFTVDGSPHDAAPGTVIYAPRETVQCPMTTKIARSIALLRPWL